jgi:glycosyltransferase involved in cell wall biosynthesis
MRILQVVALMTPDGAYGGPARVALNQGAELIARGEDVTVAAAARGYRQLPTKLAGVPVRLFAAHTVVPRTGVAGLGSIGLSRWLYSNVSDFDIVHVHLARELVVMSAAATVRRRAKRYVLQTHGQVVPSRHPYAPAMDALWTRKVLRDAGAVFYLTPNERSGLVQVGGEHLRLVPLGNGVPEYPAATRRPGTPEVLFAARMHPRKRPMVFVEMAKRLLDSGLDARFTLVGPDEGEGPALRAALEGQPRIRWEGPVAPEAMPDRMAAADIYVLPSIREPYPMSVLEAMSVGLPVVVTDDCGLAPFVEHSRSGIVADTTVGGLAAAVQSIVGDSHHAQSMGERGREMVQGQFGMAAVGDHLLRTYASLAEGCRG